MRNWTIKEAVEEINKGNQEAINEVAKHYPNAFMCIVKNDLAGLSQLMRDKFTMNRLAKVVAEATDEDDTMNAPVEEKAAKATKATAKAEEATDDGEDLESMTTKQLMQLCDKRGIKVPHYGKNKQFYLEMLQGGATEAEDEEEAEDAEEETTDAYEGKSAQELFKMCKGRGIKAEQRKPAKYYIDLLKKADEAVEEDVEEEDWEDEEEEEAPAPKKSAKPAKAAAKEEKKPAKPAKAAKKEEEDEDDDWDI